MAATEEVDQHLKENERLKAELERCNITIAQLREGHERLTEAIIDRDEKLAEAAKIIDSDHKTIESAKTLIDLLKEQNSILKKQLGGMC